MRFLLLSALVTTGSLVITGSLVAEENKPGPGERPDRKDFLEEIFARLDSDKNGSISFEEFQANPRLERANDEQKKQLFERLDKNKDGELAKDELSRPPQQHHRRRGEWLDKGPVNYEQFSQQPRLKDVPEERRRQLFDRLDRNHDQVISREDFPKPGGPEGDMPPPRPALLDADKDGKISFEEFRQAPPHRELGEDEAEDRFESLDKNGDGFLTPDEQPQPDRRRDRKRGPQDRGDDPGPGKKPE